MDPLSINGLRLSHQLVLIRMRAEQRISSTIPKLCRMLADFKVNIVFMTSTQLDNRNSAIVCIDPVDRSNLWAGLDRNADLKSCVHVEASPVGMVSVYPHRSSMTVLGTALRALNEYGIRVSAVASSISALTFIVHYHQLDKAVAVLAESMGLPSDTQPVRMESRGPIPNASAPGACQCSETASQTVNRGMPFETIAVYSESVIRTYGFNSMEKLNLYQVTLTNDEMGLLGRALQFQGAEDAVFRLIWAQTDNRGQTTFSFLCDSTCEDGINHFMTECEKLNKDRTPVVQHPVDVIWFQGPHFGDRYGIMDFTYQALTHEQIPLYAEICSVATIYLISPTGWAHRAKDALTTAFEIPNSIKTQKAAPIHEA